MPPPTAIAAVAVIGRVPDHARVVGFLRVARHVAAIGQQQAATVGHAMVIPEHLLRKPEVRVVAVHPGTCTFIPGVDDGRVQPELRVVAMSRHFGVVAAEQQVLAGGDNEAVTTTAPRHVLGADRSAVGHADAGGTLQRDAVAREVPHHHIIDPSIANAFEENTHARREPAGAIGVVGEVHTDTAQAEILTHPDCTAIGSDIDRTHTDRVLRWIERHWNRAHRR